MKVEISDAKREYREFIFSVYLIFVSVLLFSIAASNSALPFVDDFAFDSWAENYLATGQLNAFAFQNRWSGLSGHLAYPPYYLLLQMPWRFVFGNGSVATDLLYALFIIMGFVFAHRLSSVLELSFGAQLVFALSIPLSVAFVGHRPEPFAIALIVAGFTLLTSANGDKRWQVRLGIFIALIGAATSPTYLIFTLIALTGLLIHAPKGNHIRPSPINALRELASVGIFALAFGIGWLEAAGVDSLALAQRYLYFVSQVDRSNPVLQLAGLSVLTVAGWVTLRVASERHESSQRYALSLWLWAAYLLNIANNHGRLIELTWELVLALSVTQSMLYKKPISDPTIRARGRRFAQLGLFILTVTPVVSLVGQYLVSVTSPAHAQRLAWQYADDIRNELFSRVEAGQVIGIDAFVYRYVLNGAIESESAKHGILDYRFSRPATRDCRAFDPDRYRTVEYAFVNAHTLNRYPSLRKIDYKNLSKVRTCTDTPDQAWAAIGKRLSLNSAFEAVRLLARNMFGGGNRYTAPYGEAAYLLIDVSSGDVVRDFR